jgi:hypothetical protein
VAWRRHWPAVRALLIALVIAVGMVDGCPLPNNKRTSPALRPTVKRLRQLRQQVMTPFRPVREAFRLHQQWRLFPTASEKQYRLWVEGRTGRKAEWEILYRPIDPLHTFLEDPIEYRRMRGAWNPGRSARRGYAGVVKWVSDQVFAARPDLSEVRVRLEDIRIVPGEGRYESTGKYKYERLKRRQKQREQPAVEPAVPEEEPEP